MGQKKREGEGERAEQKKEGKEKGKRAEQKNSGNGEKREEARGLLLSYSIFY